MKTTLIALLAVFLTSAAAFGQGTGAVLHGADVGQDAAIKNGGYLRFSPVDYNPYDGAVCHDNWTNPVQQPMVTGNLSPFGLNDLALWNSLSPSMPFAPSAWSGVTVYVTGDLVVSGGVDYIALIPNTGVTPVGNPSTWTITQAFGLVQPLFYNAISAGPCGSPLPVNANYGLNTNGYFFGRAGLATDSALYNSIQSLQGGILGNSITMGVWYPAGTTICVNFTGSSCALTAVMGLLTGTVTTVGTAVTWASGDEFLPGMPGSFIVISGSTYVVSSYTDSHHLTLTGSAGTLGTVPYMSESCPGAEVPNGVGGYNPFGCYLGGHVDTGHSVGPPAAGGIGSVSNPFSGGEGLVAGQMYYDDGLACERLYSGAAWGCVGGTAAGLITQVQFNAGGGAFDASSNLVYDKTNSIFKLLDANIIANPSGIVSPLFNAHVARLANTPNNTFQNSDGSFFIDYLGNAGFHTAAIGALSAPVTGTGGGLGLADTLLSSTLSNLYASFNGLTPVVVPTLSTTATTTRVPFLLANGVLGGSANLVWDNTNAILTLTSVGSSSGVVAPIMNADGTSGDCWIANGGTAHTTCAGAAFAQTFTATSTFNSLADTAGSPSTTAAFQTSGGDIVIYGDGHATLQAIALTNGITVDSGTYGLSGSGVLTVASCTGCGAGGGVVSWNTRTGAVTLAAADVAAVEQDLRTSATPVFAGVDSTGAFSTTVTGGTTAYTTQGGTFHIYGNGTAGFQSITATTTFNSLADTAGSPSTTAAFQTSGGNIVIYGDGHATLQAIALTNGITVDSGTYGLNGSGVLTVASCTGCGTGAVTSWNTRTGAVTLAASDVAAVEQDLRTSASPVFVEVTASAASTNCGFQVLAAYCWNGLGDIGVRSLTVGPTGSYGITSTGAATVASCTGCTPQALAASSSPTFAGLTTGGTLSASVISASGTITAFGELFAQDSLSVTGVAAISTGIIDAGYLQVQGANGITSSTCSHWTGGICDTR